MTMTTLETQMNVTSDAARRAKLDTKNARARAKRAAKAIAAQGPLAVKLETKTSTHQGEISNDDIHSADGSCLTCGKTGLTQAQLAAHKCSSADRVAKIQADAEREHAAKKAFTTKAMVATPVPAGKVSLEPKVVVTPTTDLITKVQAKKDRLAEQDKVLAAKSKQPAVVVDNRKVSLEKARLAKKTNSTSFTTTTSKKAIAAKVEAGAPKKTNVKVALLDLMYGTKGYSASTKDVIAALQAKHPGMNESSIRVWITDFQKDGSIVKGEDRLLSAGTPGKFALKGPAMTVTVAAPKAAKVAPAKPIKKVAVSNKVTPASDPLGMEAGLAAIQASGKKSAKRASAVKH
jgi:hypothetical protein